MTKNIFALQIEVVNFVPRQGFQILYRTSCVILITAKVVVPDSFQDTVMSQIYGHGKSSVFIGFFVLSQF